MAGKIALQKISDSRLGQKKINLYLLRLDLAHSPVYGNKWYKLKYNLKEVTKEGKTALLSFGGAHSNHIWSLAAAGKEFGVKTIGIIRGEELTGAENPTLRQAKNCGMELHFVSREQYRRMRDDTGLTESFIHSQIRVPRSQIYLLPEGGSNALAVKGCAEILDSVGIPFDYVCCAVGTGGTLAGIVSSLKSEQRAIGFSVLDASGYHQREVEQWLLNFQINSFSNFQIEEGYHFGGYAKHSPELLSFISDFEKENNIPLDPVYTGKMLFGIYALIRREYFPQNSVVIAVHTGRPAQP